jgi:hypothetical protein
MDHDRYVVQQGIRRNGNDEQGVLMDLVGSFIWHRNGTQPNGTERLVKIKENPIFLSISMYNK